VTGPVASHPDRLPCRSPLDGGGALGRRPRSGTCSSWAFFASTAALRRSAKLVFLDLFISIFIRSRETALGPSGRWFQIGARHAIFQGMDETKIEKLARLSGRVASTLVGALERRGYDIRGKMSAPISGRVPRRAPPKPKSDD